MILFSFELLSNSTNLSIDDWLTRFFATKFSNDDWLFHLLTSLSIDNWLHTVWYLISKIFGSLDFWLLISTLVYMLKTSKFSDSVFVSTTLATNSSNDDSSIDSGCTEHRAFSHKYFTSLRSLQTHRVIRFGDGKYRIFLGTNSAQIGTNEVVPNWCSMKNQECSKCALSLCQISAHKCPFFLHTSG